MVWKNIKCNGFSMHIYILQRLFVEHELLLAAILKWQWLKEITFFKKMFKLFFNHSGMVLSIVQNLPKFWRFCWTFWKNRFLSRWCSGYSSRLAPMGLTTGCMCKWFSLKSMLALAGFLRDLWFPPAVIILHQRKILA